MSVSGVGTNTALMIQSLVDLRSQLDDLQRQLSTGMKSDTYAGLGSERGLVVGLSSQLSAIGSFQDSNKIVGTQLSVAQTVLGQFAKIGSDVKSAAVMSAFDLGQNGKSTDQTTAMSQLDQLVSLLNTQAGDRYIFSGRAVNQPASVTTDQILNGNGAQAGLIQIINERNQADLGTGLGRLVIPPPVGTAVSMSEDVAGSPFGFKLASVNSNLTGSTVTGPSGSPAGITVDFSGGNPNDGDTVKFTFNLPDGSTQDLTLTATIASPPGPDQFTIGATPALTAANFQTALTSSVTKLASTQLSAASAVAAAHDFFDVDAGQPPKRVAGPLFASATSLVNGTPADTVTWYTGEMGTDPARGSAVALVDSSISVNYGMRANEQALRSTLENVAVFAAMSFSPSDPNSGARYAALTQRIAPALDVPAGQQKVSDIEAELANAQATIQAATDRQTQTKTTLENMLQGIEGVSNENVAAQIMALQTQLQASLQTTSMLTKISLVNYL
jgi:flagellar hook-associated protein 3 FlgL